VSKLGQVAPESPAGGASDLIATLLGRAPRVAMGLAAGKAVWPLAKQLCEKARERTRYTVKVLSTDDVYDDLHEWVLGLLPSAQQRALVAWTSKRSDLSEPAPLSVSDGPPTRLRLRYDGSREQTIVLGGHKVDVVVSDGEQAGKDRFKPDEIVFTTYSLAGQQHLLGEIDQVVQRVRQVGRTPVFRMLNSWGDWQRLDDLPRRDLDSVVLAADQRERLVADVAEFLGAEQEYLRRCIPWHRGHLYEGPPGTGKTSVARAIASHFGLDVWYLPLSDLQKDCDLLGAMSRIGPRSMLLLEDADVFHATRQRNDDEKGVTLSGLLNALDGIATPHGLLTVLTTNTLDVLDPAVIRPGRVDLVEHFGLADRDQITRLLERWYGYPILDAGVSDISPAEVIEACKRNADPGDAIIELKSFSRAATQGNPACEDCGAVDRAKCCVMGS